MTTSAATLTVLDETAVIDAPPTEELRCPETADDFPGSDQDWSWVTAAPFRAHVRRVLTAEPLPWRAFAGYARVPDNVVRGLLGLGRRPLRRIAPHYAQALLGVEPTNLRADLMRPVEPGAALMAARALLAAGWTVARIARAGSIPESRLRALLHGEDPAITQRTVLLITAAARAHGIDPEDLESFDDLFELLAA